MQSTMLDLFGDEIPVPSSGKTSRASCPPRTMPLDAFWATWPEKMVHWNHQGENGRTLVMCVDPGEQSPGGPLTPNTSEWPNDAAVCSLWQVLEPSAPKRFFLSSTACAGILRRAANRGKELPPMLQRALEQVATGTAYPPHPSLTQCSQSSGGIGQSNQELFSQGGSGLVQGFQGDIARTLQARHDSSPCADRGMDVVAVQDVAATLRSGSTSPSAHGKLNGTDRMDLVVHTLAIRGRGDHRELETRNDGTANALLLPNGGRDGIGCGAVAFQATDYASGAFEPVDQSSPITTSADRTRAAPIQVSGVPTLSRCDTTGEGKRQDPEFTTMIPSPMQVRRLTPDECAVLQGFPKGHARIPWNRGYWAKGSCSEEARAALQESCPDGPQYKAYGNSMCTKVMFFIGKRLT